MGIRCAKLGWGLVLAAGLAGCQGMPRPIDSDPLVGGSGGSRTPAGRVAAAGDDVPPPPAGTSTSPAALTQGAIDATGDRRTAATGVVLQGPRSMDKPATATAVVATGNTVPVATAGPAAGAYEELQRELLNRGVAWQQLRTIEDDVWHYRCTIKDPRQPSVELVFEARAVGPYGLAAMRAVLDKIDQERREP